MKVNGMEFNDALLSAYLDGQLEPREVAEVEAALAQDAELQGVLAALIEADQAAQDVFAEMIDEPVPATLVAALRQEDAAPEPRLDAAHSAPSGRAVPDAANAPGAPRRPWAIAAALAGAVMIGGAGGVYWGSGSSVETQVAASWIEDIAEYHAVYAQQVRHLVEVPASEADHIETWLTGTLGADVVIPDLADEGLTFEGARLLVAAGRPVAQLLYTDASGAVVALCQIQSDAPQEAARFDEIGGFDLVSWGGVASNFVVVADEGREDLRAIVAAASDQV